MRKFGHLSNVSTTSMATHVKGKTAVILKQNGSTAITSSAHHPSKLTQTTPRNMKLACSGLHQQRHFRRRETALLPMNTLPASYARRLEHACAAASRIGTHSRPRTSHTGSVASNTYAVHIRHCKGDPVSVRAESDALKGVPCRRHAA